MDRDRIMQYLPDVMRVYTEQSGNEVGGNLHIAIDDGNLTDSDLYFCETRCIEDTDTLGLFICNCLSLLSFEDRNLVTTGGYSFNG